MNVRIVPHHFLLCDNSTWWKVQIKVTLLRIGRLRLWRWKTVGDYSSFVAAKAVAKIIVQENIIEKDW